MYISKVSIRNYRNFLNSNFVFKKGINTIIKVDFKIDEAKFGIKIPNQLSVSKEISFTFI